ncbi:hypothetical protein QZH41_005408 [Actinostola sp. cb2023]|nr:hypothetical protein QZH41_005408 [Actinostola sp. cb2023]
MDFTYSDVVQGKRRSSSSDDADKESSKNVPDTTFDIVSSRKRRRDKKRSCSDKGAILRKSMNASNRKDDVEVFAVSSGSEIGSPVKTTPLASSEQIILISSDSECGSPIKKKVPSSAYGGCIGQLSRPRSPRLSPTGIKREVKDDYMKIPFSSKIQPKMDKTEESRPLVSSPMACSSKDNKKPYKRTMKSTLAKIKADVEKCVDPKKVVHNIINSKGGIEKIRSGGELPRNRKQVYNVVQSTSRDDKISDPLEYLMEKSMVSSCQIHVMKIGTRPSSIVHRPSSIVHRPSSIVHRPSSIVHRPSSIVHRPSSIVHRPSSIVHRP